MIDYRRCGKLPVKPHTAFRDDAGSLYHEHCFTRGGFDGPFSILYHRSPPQEHGEGALEAPLWPERQEARDAPLVGLRRRHVRTQELGLGGTATTGRKPLFFNSDLTIGVVRPSEDDAFYFANGDGDDVFYIHEGRGELRSHFGRLAFGPGDYVCVPRSVAHRFVLDKTPHHWLWLECRSGLRVPAQYRNPVGQLRMDAPFTHRDFRIPELSEVLDPDAPRVVISKRADRYSRHVYRNTVLDTVGWDGTVYPFVFPISRFAPKAGQFHLPPTLHGTFATSGSLICSFVPRMVDFGEGAIPCPYPHSNVDVDEVIFYCDGDFTSRRGVSAGSLSLHPAGVPHGPQPGAYEGSIGVKVVSELAVMIDTFEPLRVTQTGRALETPGYDESFWSP